MPWEVTIRGPDGEPLGDPAAVRQQIADALPDVVFHREPSGLERIAALRARGIEYPEVIRQHLEQRPATEKAAFEGDGFALILYGFEARPLRAFHVEVRGTGHPVPALAALCRPNGWQATDDASGQPVDLAGASAEGWESFQAYRGRASRSTQASESGEQAEPGAAPDGEA